MASDQVQRLRAALPQVRSWIDALLARYASQARPVSSYDWKRLPTAYPADLLEQTNVVTLPGRLPFPPVADMGLPEFAPIQNMDFDGITFKDTFFVRQDRESEGLHFHELVHVVQWKRLGVDNFLLTYGLGLAQMGYRKSQLEYMAYSLQEMFEWGRLPATPLVPFIEEITDGVWSHAQQSL
jgi:hypothetical protein